MTSVTLFIGNLSIGGAERVTVNLGNQLNKNGHDVEVLVITEDGELVDELAPEIKFSVLSVDRMRWAAIPLARHLRRTRPDALISFMTATNVMTIVAARMARVSTTVIATEHSTQSGKRGLSIKRDMLLARYTYAFADHVVGVSEGVSADIREWARVSDNKVVTIYNPVVSEEQIGATYDSPSHRWFRDDDIEVVLSVGRHTEEKDYPTLIKAFAKLLAERESVRLVLLGGGELTPEYESLIEELGIQEEVSMPGFVTQPFPYMAHADVFALSSRVEGLSLVLIEAMACGTPVVSTDCPNGPSEVLVDGEYGELVPVGDPSSLSNALVRALTDPLAKETLRRRARDFSVDKVTIVYEELLTDM
ncbi:glycosyltransferase [Halorubrum sp. FL23]|uniref:glycosyltransferase n=1 Tax=Halorubrum sp. FL23 TaxID=3458704 RepID=UPI0040347EBE